MAHHACSSRTSAKVFLARTLAVVFVAGTILADSSAEAQYNTATFAPWQQPPNRSGVNASSQAWRGQAGVPAGGRIRQPVPGRQAAEQDQPSGRSQRTAVRPTGFDVPTPAPPANAPPREGELVPPGEISNPDGAAPAGTAPAADSYGNGGCSGGSCDAGPCDAGPCDSGWCEGGPGGMYCGPCMPLAGRLWVRAEYLLWWTQGMDVPALVTTSPPGTARDVAGRLDQSDTTILFGNSRLNSQDRSGGRFLVGCWLDPCQTSGLEGTYLTLGRKTTSFQADSNTFGILARPFGNVLSRTQFQDASLIAFPNVATGSINASVTTDFQTAELLFRRAITQQCESRIDLLIGYRYSQLEDNLYVNETTTSIDPESVIPVGTRFDVFDGFDTMNQFHGANLGIAFHEQYCRWSLDLLMKLALGGTRSRAVVDGSTTIIFPQTASNSYTGGLLAQATNIGRYQQDYFTMIPELGVTLGFDLTCRLRATFGYTLIYWSKVARAGDQIDTELNPSQFPPGTLVGAPNPQFQFRTTDFWAQGMNFGLEYHF